MTKEGLLFHAKHAFMPNSLGYCGPDENGRIKRGIEDGEPDEAFAGALERFEAAFPFLKLIARSTGNEVFDYSVPEAYWIGNSLLDRIPAAEFRSFSHRELRGKDPREVDRMFKGLGGAKPHHTFYVLSTYAASNATDGPNPSNESERKLTTLIDGCRISWGRVIGVEAKELQVERRPVMLAEGSLSLGPVEVRRVSYNRGVSPFGGVKAGDVVSIHWGYACEVLTRRQGINIEKRTADDLRSMNRYLSSRPG